MVFFYGYVGGLLGKMAVQQICEWVLLCCHFPPLICSRDFSSNFLQIC